MLNTLFFYWESFNIRVNNVSDIMNMTIETDVYLELTNYRQLIVFIVLHFQ
jgi:hypothetical protein